VLIDSVATMWHDGLDLNALEVSTIGLSISQVEHQFVSQGDWIANIAKCQDRHIFICW